MPTSFAQRKEEEAKKRKEVGAWLKRLRKDKGMTCRQMGEKLGLAHHTYVGAIERGAKRLPDHLIRSWASALKINPKAFAMTLARYYEPGLYDCLFVKKAKEQTKVD